MAGAGERGLICADRGLSTGFPHPLRGFGHPRQHSSVLRAACVVVGSMGFARIGVGLA